MFAHTATQDRCTGPGLRAVQPQANELAEVLDTAESLRDAGQHEAARTLLRQLVSSVPTFDQPWLHLLAMHPAPAEELALLEGFLQHHPQHRFAAAFKAREQVLQETLEIVELLDDTHFPGAGMNATAARKAAPARLGEYLIAQGLVTPQEIEQALAEQRRLQRLGVDERLGTLLLLSTNVTPEQLGKALSTGDPKGFGEFGRFLIDSGRLTVEQVSAALAQQTMLTAEAHLQYMVALDAYQRWPLRRLFGKPCRKRLPKLGEVLVRMGLLSRAEVNQMLHEREKTFHGLFK